jgi:hypothetical protein
MICPIMSKPVVRSTVESGGDQIVEMFWVKCEQEYCKMYHEQAQMCTLRAY